MKIEIPIVNRANYGRLRSLCILLSQNESFELSMSLLSSSLLDKYGSIENIVKADTKITPKNFFTAVEGDNSTSKCSNIGLILQQYSAYLEAKKPDAVICIGDRFEMLGCAMSTYLNNIPLIHIQGGEKSGTLDDRTRNAITKLSNYHFVSNLDAKEKLISIGESDKNIFISGCPGVDNNYEKDISKIDDLLKNIGTGEYSSNKFVKGNFFVVLYHPDTELPENDVLFVERIYESIKNSAFQILWLWPNIDKGASKIVKKIKNIHLKNSSKAQIKFIKSIDPISYSNILGRAKLLIGNSSSFVREASYIGTPVILTGKRQSGRLKGSNIINVIDPDELNEKLIEKYSKKDKIKDQGIYGLPGASTKIMNHLKKINISSNKF